jgi:hypothetical protein
MGAADSADVATGLTLDDSASWYALEARRLGAGAENAAKEMDRLLTAGRMDDAARVAEVQVRPSVETAAIKAKGASDVAVELQNHADAAQNAVAQAQDLVALAAQPEWQADPAWLVQTQATVEEFAREVDRVQERAREIGHVALDAAATSIQANVRLDQAKGNLNLAKISRDMGYVAWSKEQPDQSAGKRTQKDSNWIDPVITKL